MTELLKDMLHERANSLGAPDLDVLAMVREGNRRATRRRTTLIGLGAAAAVVAAIAVPSALNSGPDTARELQPTSTFTTPQASYADGSTVHVGDTSYDVGHRVQDLFVTTAGIVFADEAGTVYASDGTGSTEIGDRDVSAGRMVGDGSRAGWVDDEEGAGPVFVVFDQATGETERIDYQVGDEGPTEHHPDLFAIDGDDVYLRDGRGVIRWNLDSGEQTVLGQPVGAEIQDVKSGVIAHTLPPDPELPNDVESFAGADFGLGGPLDLTQAGALNPSGTRLWGVRVSGGPVLADTGTGAITDLGTSGYDLLEPYAWLDDDTFAAAGTTQDAGSARRDVLACDVGGTCTLVSADVPDSITYSIGYAGSVG